MLFNSLHFLFFFPIVVIVFIVLPQRHRWLWLLAASYYFYASWWLAYAALLVLSTLAVFAAGLAMERASNVAARKFYLLVCLAFNLGLLIFFKYLNFFSTATADLLGVLHINFSVPVLNVLLPVGISFYTFKSISYIIDVYRRKIAAERHLGHFALYVSFFPQILAGPIERAGNFLPQLREAARLDPGTIAAGLTLMLWGFFKKVVIADGLAVFVERVYGSLPSYSGPALAVATVLYSFQIYADFSGYSDIAIGAARVLGIKTMDNFRAPYLARSLAEFWRRWHISLSSWFADYVFTPLYLHLGRTKAVARFSTRARHWLAFAAAMLAGEALLGLWHGANWTFVAFGLWHGVFIIIYYLARRWWDKLPNALAIGLTFAIVSGSWIFFRAGSISDSWYVFTHLLVPSQYGIWHDIRGIFLHYEYELAIIVIPLLIAGAAHFLERKPGALLEFLSARRPIVRWSVYWFILTIMLLFGTYGSKEFVYFNF